MTIITSDKPRTKRHRRMAREPNEARKPNTAATDPSQPSTMPTPAKAPSKASLVLNMLRRFEGASVEQLVAATRWLPHTVRATLTGLRKKGYEIAKDNRDAVNCYFIKAGTE